MLLLYIYCAVASLPVARQTLINGRYGTHNSELTITNAESCDRVQCASNDETFDTLTGVIIPYTIVCVDARRGNGWTYNTVLADGAHDTYANAYGVISVNTPAACVLAPLALFVQDKTFTPPNHLDKTLDIYWIEQLHLRPIPDSATEYGVHGKRDANLLLSAMLRNSAKVTGTAITTARTGPLYFVTVDEHTYQAQHIVPDKTPLANLDVARLAALSVVATEAEQKKPVLLSVGVGIALLPQPHLSGVLGGALLLSGAIWCSNDCGNARMWAFGAAGGLLLSTLIYVFLRRHRTQLVVLIGCNVALIGLSGALEATPPGNWAPPLLLVQLFMGVGVTNVLHNIMGISSNEL